MTYVTLTVFVSEMSDAVSEIFASVLLSAFIGGAIVIVCFMIEKWGTSGTKSSALLDIGIYIHTHTHTVKLE